MKELMELLHLNAAQPSVDSSTEPETSEEEEHRTASDGPQDESIDSNQKPPKAAPVQRSMGRRPTGSH